MAEIDLLKPPSRQAGCDLIVRGYATTEVAVKCRLESLPCVSAAGGSNPSAYRR